MDGGLADLPIVDGPAKAGDIALAPDAAPAGALRAVAQVCALQLRRRRAELDKGPEPEALHQARVAIRRWRSALSILGARAGNATTTAKAELKWLAGQLDEARDLDVLAQALGTPGRSGGVKAGAAALDAVLQRARARAHERAAAALGSERAQRLMRAGARPAVARRLTPAPIGPSARDLVARSLKRRRKALIKGGARLATLSPEAQHRLRIQAKKARYATELFGSLFGHPRRQARFAKALRSLQTALGELNDIHVGQGLAARIAAEADDAEAGFAAGLMLGSRGGGRGKLTRRAEQAYERFVEAAPFW